MSLSLGLILAPIGLPNAFAQPTRSPIPEQVTQIEGHPFPKQVAGLSRKEKIVYDNSSLGFSVSYAEQGKAWADIYVYNLGKDLTSVPQAIELKDQMALSLREVTYAVSVGAYEDAKVISQATEATFAKAHLTITQNGMTRHSYLFITMHGRNFVKIRLTASGGENSDQLANQFISKYVRLLGK